MNRNNELVLRHAGYERLELVAATLRNAFLKLHRAWIAARARSALHELSDRTLRDIGLTRAQIDGLFR